MLMVKHVLKRRWGSKNDWSLRDCLDEMNRREYNERKKKNFESLINVSKLIGRNIICFIDFFIEVSKISFVLS